MSQYKNQHFIPKCYLKAWCDPSIPIDYTPYVWVFSKDGSISKNKSPEKIFCETDMYTIKKDDGVRDLVLEHGLSELETRFSAIRDRTLNSHQRIKPIEHIQICTFIAAMEGRTKASREHQRQQWEKPLKLMERMMEWAKTATPEERKQAANMSLPHASSRPGLTYEQVKAVVENPLRHTLPAIISASTPLLCKLDFAVLSTTDDIGFITSDHPCVSHDPEGYKRPPMYQSPGLVYETIEITLPISPEQCIFLNRQGIKGYLPIKQNMLDDINRRTRFHSAEYFVVRKNEKRNIWCDPGIEPEDSWEKVQQRKQAGK